MAAPGKRRSRIHEGLVGPRALVGTPYLADAGLRADYVAEIAPRTAAMLTRIFDLHVPGLVPRRVLDLGAGTGIVAHTLRARFGTGLEVVAVDRVAGPGITVVSDLSRPGLPEGVRGRFDLIVAAHLLNEFASHEPSVRAERVRSWLATWLAPQGHLLIIEPALKETSRALLQVRDHLVAAGAFVVAPCLTQAPCPALAHPRDWCHDSAPRAQNTRADFSYLVIAPQGTAPRDPTWLRVVSDLKKEKGRTKWFGCGVEGRSVFELQTRDVTSHNEAFLRLERGRLCRVSQATPSGAGRRIGPDALVTQVAPSSRA